MVPLAGRGTGEVGGVERAVATEADRELAAFLGRIRVDQEATVVFMVVARELHRDVVVVRKRPFEPELNSDLVGCGEVQARRRRAVQAVESAAVFGSPTTPPSTPKVTPPDAVAGLAPALSAKIGPLASPILQ